MHLTATRQHRAGLHRQIVGQPLSIAKGNNPGIVHQQEIQHCPLKIRVRQAGAKLVLSGTGRALKHRQDIVVARQPGHRLQPDHFRIFPRNRHVAPILKLFINHHKQILTVRWGASTHVGGELVKREWAVRMTGRILIVDGLPTNRIVMRVKLATAFYDVFQSHSGADALVNLPANRPDLIIMAQSLPDMEGLDLCRRIRGNPLWADIPVILVQRDADAAQRINALQAGADDVLIHPVDDVVLLARIRSLLRARNAEAELRLRDDTERALGLAEDTATFVQPAHVALVPTALRDESLVKAATALRGCMSDRITVLQPDDALRNPGNPPEVYVIVESPNGKGNALNLLSDLRSRTETRHAAIIYIAAPDRRPMAAAALDLGADDLMADGMDIQELALRLQKQIARKRTNDRLRANMRDGLRAAVTDPLTGLFNRRYALPHLARLSERAAQVGRPFAVMIADLDHFKQVNDQFGHLAGDKVLTTVAQRLADNLRAADLIARIGGEEFLIVMPDTTHDHALDTASRLCRLIARHPVALGDDVAPVSVTLSIGIAIGPARGGAKPLTLIDLADRALYAAKADGRNQALIGTAAA